MVPDDPELVRRSEKRTYEDGRLLTLCLRMNSSVWFNIVNLGWSIAQFRISR